MSNVLPFDIKSTFEKWVKHKDLPRNDFEKQAVLIGLLEEFKDDTKYNEQEVNEIIQHYFPDYALVRRELVNFGYMRRDTASIYSVAKRECSEEDLQKNTILRRHAEPYLKRKKE